jgi:hypothetical protein
MRHWTCEGGHFSSFGYSRNSPVSRASAPRTWQSDFRSQKGETLGMPVSRAMPSVAAGVSELRIRDRDGIYRVFYYRQSPRGVLILHAFMKKTQATPARDIAVARLRLKELLDEKE